MAIQFNCPSCRQPIEVDDEHAGQVASCPYCRGVVTVPQTSTYQTEPVPAARPSNQGVEYADNITPPHSAPPVTTTPPPPDSLHVGTTYNPRQQSAQSFGTYALICAVLMVLLFGVVMVQLLTRTLSKLDFDPATQPIDQAAMNQASTEATQELSREPIFLAPLIGSMFFGVVGVALAITSLFQSSRGNWRGIVSLILCGLYVICICGGNLVALVSGLGMTPA